MDVEAQIEGFIAKFSDDVAAQIRAARTEMRRRLPGAVEMVYDNYNALAIGYGPTDKRDDVVFSIAGFPRWVRLFFYWGARLDDPAGLLEGEGAQVRSILLQDLSVLDDPRVQALMAQALAMAKPIDVTAPSRSIVKSISAKQKPRRPA
jgi:hypothetical protein